MATEFERKRLENIRRNDEMLAALNVRAKASLLTAATKRPRDESTKSLKKKEKPIVIRKSLRTRGLNPDSVGLPYRFSGDPKRMAPPPQKLKARLPFDKAYGGEGSYKKFVETVLGTTASNSMVKDDSPIDCSSTRRRSSRLSNVNKAESVSSSDYVKKEAFVKKPCGGKLITKDESDDCLNKEASGVMTESIEFEEGGSGTGPLSLESNNVARVVPGRVFVVKFMPCQNVKLVAAGDKLGNVGFWNLDGEDDGIYLFHPHTAPVSSLVFHQNSFSKASFVLIETLVGESYLFCYYLAFFFR